mmetsp:Transcript_4179/g.8919  ORF Transcript_4179/g.8919 Transcript_4179/m.8919 type:complete len:300 (-) Transcript_4179:316-1215(-)
MTLQNLQDDVESHPSSGSTATAKTDLETKLARIDDEYERKKAKRNEDYERKKAEREAELECRECLLACMYCIACLFLFVGMPVIFWKAYTWYHAPPNRVVTVFGLDASGTSFLYHTLSTATKATTEIDGMTSRNRDTGVDIQQFPLPWGFPSSSFDDIATVDVAPPPGCAKYYNQTSPGEKQEPNCPSRFYVDITSHVEWYRNQGIDMTAVIVVEDESESDYLEGRSYHQTGEGGDMYGEHLLIDAINALDNSVSPNGYSELVMVRLDLFKSRRTEYLMELYDHLGVASTYVPPSLWSI